jgi:superfamily I DNA/RNA helicase
MDGRASQHTVRLQHRIATLEEYPHLGSLDDRQLSVVHRDYTGPARIGGPAGTGKTIVALHRMARLARQTTGRLLYVTFVTNLPRVQSAAYRQLAPESAHRAEFTNVHAWALDLLLRRGVAFEGDRRAAEAAFTLAWSRVGAAGPLAALAADPRYWREEIDHVIKGRGLTSAEEYLRLPRHGRRLRLDRGARAAMWDLYAEYEQLRTARGAADHNDLLLAAIAELRRSPLDPPYAAVIADEVQDINLVGLRLLHAIGGDGPNGLLLVGDGQQAVYPAGSRLSEAGIPIQGRGEILRVNYRNASEVLAVARQLDPVNHFDDLDGAAAVTLSEVEATQAGGTAQHYVATTAEDHDVELVTAVRSCQVAPRDIAVLTSTSDQAKYYRRMLHDAQIPAVNLADYEGRRIEAVKVGTIRRAKGLEFRAVFLPYRSLLYRSRPGARGGGRPGGRAAGGTADERREVGVREVLVGLTRARDFLWTGCVVGWTGCAAGAL